MAKTSAYVYNSRLGEVTGGTITPTGTLRGSDDADARWKVWTAAAGGSYIVDTGKGVVLTADMVVGALKIYEVPPDKRIHNISFEHLADGTDFDAVIAVYETNTLPTVGGVTNNYLSAAGLAYGPFRVVRDATLRTVPNPRIATEKKYLIFHAVSVGTQPSTSMTIDIDSSNPYGDAPDNQVQ